jgi:hypothetical protein
MRAKRISFVVLAVTGALLAGCSGGGRIKAPSLGYVEHRGQPYQIRDLMDPQYRAESSDRFARDFQPDIAFVARFNDPALTPSALGGME